LRRQLTVLKKDNPRPQLSCLGLPLLSQASQILDHFDSPKQIKFLAQIRHERKSALASSVISVSILSPRVTFEDIQLGRVDSRATCASSVEIHGSGFRPACCVNAALAPRQKGKTSLVSRRVLSMSPACVDGCHAYTPSVHPAGVT